MGLTVKGLGVPGTGLQLWLDAGVLATGAVALWPDLSGNGNHATQTTGANQPTCVPGVVNGHAVVRFNGTSHFLATSALVQASANFSMFAVQKSDVTNSVSHVSFLNGNDNNSGYALYINNANKRGVLIGGKSVGVDGNATTNWEIWAGIGNGSSQILSVNGSINVLVSVTPNTPTTGTFIGSTQGPAFFWDGDIAEIIIYNRALLTSERQSVERYLANKYNIALS